MALTVLFIFRRPIKKVSFIELVSHSLHHPKEILGFSHSEQSLSSLGVNLFPCWQEGSSPYLKRREDNIWLEKFLNIILTFSPIKGIIYYDYNTKLRLLIRTYFMKSLYNYDEGLYMLAQNMITRRFDIQ